MAVENRFAGLLGEKMARENRVITEADVARDIGVTRQVINKWANNKIKRFDSDMIEKFCNYFGCTPGDLIVIVNRNPEISTQS